MFVHLIISELFVISRIRGLIGPRIWMKLLEFHRPVLLLSTGSGLRSFCMTCIWNDQTGWRMFIILLLMRLPVTFRDRFQQLTLITFAQGKFRVVTYIKCDERIGRHKIILRILKSIYDLFVFFQRRYDNNIQISKIINIQYLYCNI